MRFAIVAPLTVIASFAVTNPAHATFVDFTCVSVGPSNAITIGDITITGDNGALVASTAGEGLGVVGVGANSDITQLFSWAEGSPYDQGS
jgi:hypothetical protein